MRTPGNGKGFIDYILTVVKSDVVKHTMDYYQELNSGVLTTIFKFKHTTYIVDYHEDSDEYIVFMVKGMFRSLVTNVTEKFITDFVSSLRQDKEGHLYAI